MALLEYSGYHICIIILYHISLYLHISAMDFSSRHMMRWDPLSVLGT